MKMVDCTGLYEEIETLETALDTHKAVYTCNSYSCRGIKCEECVLDVLSNDSTCYISYSFSIELQLINRYFIAIAY